MAKVVGKIGRCSSDGYGNIPIELIEEIALRSDAKSVIRLKCVCKSWLSRLSDPSFMNAHHKRQPPQTLMGNRVTICCQCQHHTLERITHHPQFSVRVSESFDQTNNSSHVYKFPKKASEVIFVGSQNGVICLRERSENHVHLWNPAIEKHKKLPQTPPPPNNHSQYLIHGFGYEPLTNDFKVVAVCGGEDGGRLLVGNYFLKDEQVSVYSFRSDSWKTTVMPALIIPEHKCVYTTIARAVSERSVVVSGSIHWPISIQSGRKKLEIKMSDEIVAFDLSSEEFKLIEGPSSLKNDDDQLCIECASLFGCLSLITVSFSFDIKIWVMKEYGVRDSWTTYLNVNLSVPPYPTTSNFMPFGISHHGNMLVESTTDGENWVVSFYDPKSRTVQDICRREFRSFLATYSESIFLS